MGYMIRIGELRANIEDDSSISHSVELVENEGAPAFGEPTDYENQRWPSYTAWKQSMRFVGLFELSFNDNDGLMREHPGCFGLTQYHKDAIDIAHKEFYRKYPAVKAGFTDEISAHAARLEWLKYWVDWALANCKVPCIFNC